MPAQLDKLDREAAVMMYLAGELEPAEREAFERQIAAKPELAAEVEQVRAAQAMIATELETLDAHARLPASEGVVVRRVSRAIANWLATRSVGPTAVVKRGWNYPWWAWPTAAAASLLIGFLVWSSRQEVPPLDAAPEAKRGFSLLEAEQAELADWLTNSLTAEGSLDAEMEQLTSASGADDFGLLYPPPREEVSQ